MMDLSGLTDRAIARMPGNVLDRQIDPGAFFARRPEAFVFVSQRPVGSRSAAELPPSSSALAQNNPYWPPGSSARLLGHPAMRKEYAFVAQYPPYHRLVRGPEGALLPAEPGDPGGTPITYFLDLYVRKDVAIDAAK